MIVRGVNRLSSYALFRIA